MVCNFDLNMVKYMIAKNKSGQNILKQIQLNK